MEVLCEFGNIKTEKLIKKLVTTPYIIYAQIGFSTNRQTFNNNIASAENLRFLHFENHKLSRCKQFQKLIKTNNI